jgi:hypothetical protein
MSHADTVTLATNCWERDWQDILTTDRLELLASRNCHHFTERILTINNVSDPERVRAHAEEAVKLGRIDRYLRTEDYADETLRHFELTLEDFRGGYNYSIAPLVALLQCRSKYLLYFTGDCIPSAANAWIDKALAVFSDDPRVKAANLSWNHREAAEESLFSSEDFHFGYGFSDQCFLVPVADFRGPIYHEKHVLSERYPSYAGETFEKRVDSWMRNNAYLRATSRHATYKHRLAAH